MKHYTTTHLEGKRDQKHHKPHEELSQNHID